MAALTGDGSGYEGRQAGSAAAPGWPGRIGLTRAGELLAVAGRAVLEVTLHEGTGVRVRPP